VRFLAVHAPLEPQVHSATTASTHFERPGGSLRRSLPEVVEQVDFGEPLPFLQKTEKGTHEHTLLLDLALKFGHGLPEGADFLLGCIELFAVRR
jgi:hypothetical protein